jgi:predicted DNA binding CopG/RHH family protein
MKVPEPLLESFKFKAKMHGKPYQTLIKELMQHWLRQ